MHVRLPVLGKEHSMKKALYGAILFGFVFSRPGNAAEYPYTRCAVPGFACDVVIHDRILSGSNAEKITPYALVSSDSGIGVVDISRPGNPVLTSFLSLPGYGHECAVWGQYAYVTDGSGKAVQVVDISNLDTIEIAGSFGDSCGYVWGLDLVSESAGEPPLICAVGSVRGMQWYDVSTLSNCVKIGEYSPYSGLMSEISPDISFRDYDYLNTSADRDSSVRYYPFDSCYPPMEDERAMVRKTEDVEIIKDTAFILYYDNTECGSGLYLKKVDISQPEAPECLDSTGCFGWGCGFTVAEDNVYVAHVLGVDSYDRAGLELSGYFSWGIRKEDIVVENGTAYVTCNDIGVMIIDVSDPDTMFLKEMVAVPGNSYGIAVKNGSLFVASGDSGLFIFSDVVHAVQRKAATGKGARIIDRIVTGNRSVRLVFNCAASRPFEIQVFTIQGRLLNSVRTDKMEYIFENPAGPGRHIPFGMYCIEVKNGTCSTSRRVFLRQ